MHCSVHDCSISHLARPHCLRNPLISAMAQLTLFGGVLKSPVGSFVCGVGSRTVRFYDQALQSHRRHKHPGASALAPGGAAPALAVEPRPALAVEPAPCGGHAGPASAATAAAPLSGRRGAPERSRFTGHEKVDLVKRSMKDIDSGMGQRAVANRLGVSQSMLSKWVREYKKGDFDDRNSFDTRARDGYWPGDARAVDKDVLAEIKKKRIAHTIFSEISREVR